MSNIYIQEPPTNGKVLLKTTVGDIDIELWSKEAPLACKNFVQLCLEGYYNGNIFHRLVKGFIVQTGDASGTGMGSESIYGEPFKDEFHSRLRFVRRGLVALANDGNNDSNGSQFFFTLDACPELQNKHTIFGKVSGNTLYNMLRLGEGEVDRNERPIHVQKIRSVEVLHNPFPDIVVRVKEERKKEKTKEEKARDNVKASKNFSLLSFGDEAEEEDKEISKVHSEFKSKSKSSHDLLTDDAELSSIPAIDKSQFDDDSDELEYHTSKNDDNEKKNSSRLAKVQEKLNASRNNKKNVDDFDFESIFDEERSSKKNKNLETAKEEFEKLKKQMLKDIKEKKIPTDNKKKKEKNIIMEEAKMIKKEIPKKGSNREEKLWEAMQDFKQNLLHSKEQKSNNKTSWFSHKMQCTGEDEIVLAKDANIRNEEDWYDINDPKNPINKRRREQ